MVDTIAPLSPRKRGRPVRPPMITVTMPAKTLRMIEKTFEWIDANRVNIGGQVPGGKNSTEAAKYIGVSKAHLVRNLKEEIGYKRLKRAFIFRTEDLDRWLEKRTAAKNYTTQAMSADNFNM